MCEVRAQQDGAGQPRRRLARRGAGDRRGARLPAASSTSTCGPSAPRRSSATCSRCASCAMEIAGVDPCEEPIPIRPTPHYFMGGVKADVDGARAGCRGLLRRRRGELHQRARRQPPGRQLAARRRCVFGRRAGEAAAACAGGLARAPEFPPAALPESRREIEASSSASERRAPGHRSARAAALMLREGRHLPRARVRCRRRSPASRALKERYARVSSATTRARCSTPTSCRPSRPGTCSTSPSASRRARSTREESRGSHARTDFPERDDAALAQAQPLHHATPTGRVCDYAPVPSPGISPKRGATDAAPPSRSCASTRRPAAARPHAQRYDVELPDGSTVLEALMAVQDDQDGTLAFRRACRHAICGSCGMRINGCARLACNTQLAGSLGAGARAWLRSPGQPAVRRRRDRRVAVRIEPLGNMPVIKDLVTDMDDFWRKLAPRAALAAAARPRRPTPTTSGRMSPRQWDESPQARALPRVRRLLLGLRCAGARAPSSSVPRRSPRRTATSSTRATTPPHARAVDLSDEHGLWECTRCYFCTQRCPKHIRVRELIARARRPGLRRGPARRSRRRGTRRPSSTRSRRADGSTRRPWR